MRAAPTVRAWNGTTFSDLNSALTGPFGLTDTYAQTLWDPDGPGPTPSRLVICGSFDSVGGVPARNIAINDGAQWSALGAGLELSVTALSSWDPDDNGPLPPFLVAGGEFRVESGGPVVNVALWDGVSWTALPDFGPGAMVYALTSFDVDGPGPSRPVLVAGGFPIRVNSNLTLAAVWNGTNWQPLTSGISGEVFGMGTWDPDGAGPRHRELVLAKYLDSSIRIWDGVVMRSIPLAAYVNGNTQFLAQDIPGDPQSRQTLIMNMEGSLARVLAEDAPEVSIQPQPQTARAGRNVDFLAVGTGPATYQWRKNGQPILSGYRNALTLFAVRLQDDADFDCVISTPCGSVITDTVHLTVLCSVDIDQNGSVSIQDVFTYLEAYFRGDLVADMNGSSTVNFNDLSLFLSLWFQGCP